MHTEGVFTCLYVSSDDYAMISFGRKGILQPSRWMFTMFTNNPSVVYRAFATSNQVRPHHAGRLGKTPACIKSSSARTAPTPFALALFECCHESLRPNDTLSHHHHPSLAEFLFGTLLSATVCFEYPRLCQPHSHVEG